MIMNRNRRLYTLGHILLMCLALILPQNLLGIETETTFRITVLKSNGQPQPGIILKISGRSQEYTGDAQGIITFRYATEDSYTRTANLYFPTDRNKSVASFALEAENATRTFYLDSPQDIVAFKQSQQTFPVEGIVSSDTGEPITGAIISILGTGRRTTTDEIGLFHIDDRACRRDGQPLYSHPTVPAIPERTTPHHNVCQKFGTYLCLCRTDARISRRNESLYKICKKEFEIPRTCQTGQSGRSSGNTIRRRKKRADHLTHHCT